MAVDEANDFGVTPLMLAASVPGSDAIVELLLARAWLLRKPIGGVALVGGLLSAFSFVREKRDDMMPSMAKKV